MATQLPSGMPQLMLKKKRLPEESIEQAIKEAKQSKVSFAQTLVEQSYLSAREIAEFACENLGTPYLDLEAYQKENVPQEVISHTLIKKHSILPLYQRGDMLFIAIADPSQQNTLNEIKFHTGLNTYYITVELDKLNKLIDDTLHSVDEEALTGLDDSTLEALDISGDEDLHEEEQVEDDAPIVRFVHKAILDAIHRGASDIHFEPYEKFYRVRFRLDGILYEIAKPPVNLANRITSRIKVMANLDISERRVPQDGRFKMRLSRSRSIDFRISTCPTVNGEKVVIRILDPTAANVDIEALGMRPEQKTLFMEAIQQPQGIIIVTGPTGSGKTVSLYSALRILNTTEKNTSSAEDPVEIKLEGINQVNINPKTGLTFAAALRSFLRQDPDIIMVGEMRDLETAEIGIKAAQTGHLVLTTLHTNSAPETLTRLANMGVAPFNIATSVNLIMAQRLARRLCKHCKTAKHFPEEALLQEGFKKEDLPGITVYEPVGCDKCTQGYKGRIGIFEVLKASETIGELIMTGKSSLDIDKQARAEGMLTLRESGLQIVRDGITSLEELNRVTKD